MLFVVKLYIGLRLLLAASKPDLWRALDSFVELSTPMTSFLRLGEGLYLYNNLGISPYGGGPCHVSPLLLAIFSFAPKLVSFLLFIAADVSAASALASYTSRGSLRTAFSQEVVAAVYLLNPYSLLSSLAQSSNVITNSLICVSLNSASQKHGGAKAMAFLALATSLSWYPMYLITGIIGVVRQTAGELPKKAYCKLVTIFLVTLGACLVLSYVPVQSWDFLDAQFGTLLALKDLTRPNIGLWWYFFIEQFDFFRPFFLGAFQLVLSSFVIPITLRFPNQPLFIVCALTGILAVLKPYPEASDLGLYLSLLVLNRPVFDMLEYQAIEALGICYVTALAPAFYYLWIYVGSGNANFFYAITLVYTVTMVLLFADSTWAAIRLDYDGGKSKNLTQL